ncbi:hypothetical protein P7C73_g1392, partial [Tremellales sp. Uapishka_1]
MTDTNIVEDGVRPFSAQKDDRIVKMIIGQGIMEGLAYANRRVYTHMFSLSLWVILSLVLDKHLGYTVDPAIVITWFSPLIGFGLTALPLLGLVEFLHRPKFTRHLRETIGSPDLVSIANYYSAPESTVLVLHHKDLLVGVIAVDAVHAAEEQASVLGGDDGEITDASVKVDLPLDKIRQSKKAAGLRQRVPARKTKSEHPGLAQIRHLDVDALYRRAGVATELLAAALDKSFGISPKAVSSIEQVIVLTSPFTPGKEEIFRKFGFKPVPSGTSLMWPAPRRLGVLGWKGRWMSISKSEWAAKRNVLFK